MKPHQKPSKSFVAGALSLLLFVALASNTGCSTLPTGIVTVTSVVDGAMKTWAHLSNTHQTSPQLDERVKAAHERYRAAAAIASISLKAYKASGNKVDLQAAITTAQAAAGPLIELIAGLLASPEASTLKNNLLRTNAP